MKPTRRQFIAAVIAIPFIPKTKPAYTGIDWGFKPSSSQLAFLGHKEPMQFYGIPFYENNATSSNHYYGLSREWSKYNER